MRNPLKRKFSQCPAQNWALTSSFYPRLTKKQKESPAKGNYNVTSEAISGLQSQATAKEQYPWGLTGLMVTNRHVFGTWRPTADDRFSHFLYVPIFGRKNSQNTMALWPSSTDSTLLLGSSHKAAMWHQKNILWLANNSTSGEKSHNGNTISILYKIPTDSKLFENKYT